MVTNLRTSDNDSVRYLVHTCGRTVHSIIGGNIKYIERTYKVSPENLPDFKRLANTVISNKDLAALQAIDELRHNLTGLSVSESNELFEFLAIS